MNTRLEILIDGVWKSLELFDRASIKYNKVVNKIASISTREISHSNTLSIPRNHNNRTVLGINVFNKQQLAKALNSRYQGKYYIDDKLVQEGFVVINKAQGEDIRINFIDTGLEVVDFWGELNFRQLLNDPSLSIPDDYEEAISEMKRYVLPRNQVATPLSEVGTRGYDLCLFPNNLNAIGDKYMLDANEVRPADKLNPYQSRPLFNVKAIFDLASEAFGYEPIFDTSVSWNDVAEHYIVSSGLSSNFVDDGITTIYSTITFDNDSVLINSNPRKVAIISTSSRSEKPNNLTGWNDPETGWLSNHLDENVIFKPDLELQGNGVIRYRVRFGVGDTTVPTEAWGVWKNAANDGVVFKELFVENAAIVGGNTLEYDINKVALFDPPQGAGDFVGVLSTIENNGTVLSYQITESFIPIESVDYDELGQFRNQNIDLTYAAPSDNIKTLMIGLMTHFGILMNIDSRSKTIRFFNYSRYLDAKEDGKFLDLSEYLQEYEPFEYNTDFGNSFGKLNEVGLNNSFRGNTFFVTITNQGNDSKLKDFATNKSKTFKDVSSINRIPNNDAPFVEYTNTGLGLVKRVGVINGLSQIRFVENPSEGAATFTEQGPINDMPTIEAVRFGFLPVGVSEWYRLVQESVKANPKFLLPLDLVRNLDLSLPVYIEQLGGFYIIEEISEYQNPQTLVTVKVIKLIDGAEFSNDFSEAFNI